MAAGSEAIVPQMRKPWRGAVSQAAGVMDMPERPRAIPDRSGIGEKDAPARRIAASQVSEKVIMAHCLSTETERKHYFSIERYRLLCARVLQTARNTRAQVFLTASALAEEGKTLTTANLAYAMSCVEGKRTLLLELDLRRPSLRRLLAAHGDPDEPLFVESEDWHDHRWELRPNLHALIAPRAADRPDELLHGERVRTLIEEARHEYDYVLIDSAPLLLAVDTHVLLPQVDHALLMVRAGYTPIECTQDALRALGDKGLGCILNDVKRLKYEEYYRTYYR